MSVRYEEREIKQPTIVQSTLVEAICDRCGANALYKGFGGGIWGAVEVNLQGHAGEPPERRDLCRECSEELLQIIDAPRMSRWFRRRWSWNSRTPSR